MLSRFPFLPGGLALIASSCAMPQPGLRRTTPVEHTVIRGDQLHTERQILEDQPIHLLTVFGNLAAQDQRPMNVHLSSVLEAPMVGGLPLRVTRLVQQNTLLVAGYAGPDGRALGALALLDLTDPEAPLLRAELQLPTMTVYDLVIEGSQVYFAGSSANQGTTVIGRISVQGFEWQNDLTIQTLELNSVGGLAVFGERILVLDRTQSQMAILSKKDGTLTSQMSVPALNQLGRDASSLWAVRGEELLQLDTDLHVKASFNSGRSQFPVSAVIHIGQETVLTALGDGGVRAFCQSDQKPLFHVPAVIRADRESERTLTQDAALSHGLLFTANGDAGVYLYSVTTGERKDACRERAVQVEGYLDLGKDFRAHAVSWQQDVLSIGDGKGRLNLLYIDRDNRETDDTDFDG